VLPEPLRGEELLQGHKETIDAIAFSPDGKRAVSTSLDHNVHLWDL